MFIIIVYIYTIINQYKYVVMESNQVNLMPRIGDNAPSFHAITTQGEINFPDDYVGKWVILFSHPADFTPDRKSVV